MALTADTPFGGVSRRSSEGLSNFHPFRGEISSDLEVRFLRATSLGDDKTKLV
jgi:hypothetical protein